MCWPEARKPSLPDSVPPLDIKVLDEGEEGVEQSEGRARTKRQASTQVESYHVEMELILDHTFWN